ncbi:PAS domain-containing protein [Rubellimicrobium roseum]|uniref:histidine kinase n=1 Tax=Rubellimicrobium roseum TaxID=687525 RepID=A0A5C4NDH2_9RHOB|nr:PAS domain-containing protein [Rubellimicrobium roseum]TNC72152.1 PAS domain S-box protein [Rubellimicrobium roseum]
MPQLRCSGSETPRRWNSSTSASHEDIYGVPLGSTQMRNSVRRWMELVLPEDRALALDHLRRVRAAEHVLHAYRILRPDGEVRWIRDTGFPLLDRAGGVQRVAGIGHDATEKVELNDHLRVLVAELQHRSRKLVSGVKGVVERTLAGSETLEDCRPRFRSSVKALARVNGLLPRLEEGQRITFDQLLRTELAAHGVLDGEDHGGQVRPSGPTGVLLPSSTVQTFALVLQELATNALKHGALSRSERRLDVPWALVHGRRESGGCGWNGASGTGRLGPRAKLLPRRSPSLDKDMAASSSNGRCLINFGRRRPANSRLKA